MTLGGRNPGGESTGALPAHPAALSGKVRLEVRRAAEEDVYKDLVRVPEGYRRDRLGQTISEGECCKLSAQERSVFVLIRGQRERQECAIWLDERTRNRLGLAPGGEADFEMQRVGLWGQVRWAWSASDPAYRVAARLAVLSVVLGFLGLLLGMWSLLLTLRTAA